MTDCVVLRKWIMLFFEVLLLTDKKDKWFLVCLGFESSDTPRNRRVVFVGKRLNFNEFFSGADRVVLQRWAMLFFEVLPLMMRHG